MRLAYLCIHMRNLVICAVCAGLKIDKSMLTGEAEPVEGSGSGIVIAVGNDNQVRPTDLKLQSEMMTR